MKKIIIIILSILFYTLSFPQTSPKIYVDTTTNKIYYNKNLPVYFWISNAPDNSGQNVLLQPIIKKYANPYYFDTEGINTFRVKKPKGQYNEAIFEIWADCRPPIVKYDIKNSKKIYKNNTIYIGSKAKIYLKAYDGISKISNIYYSLDNKDFITYKNPIHITKPGENIIKFFGCDVVGNYSDTISLSLYADLTPPDVFVKILNTFSDSILGKISKISFIAIDSVVGLSSIFYSKSKKGKYIQYHYPINLYNAKPGKNKLFYYAIDNVGNKSEIKTFNYIVDLTPPTISYKIIGPYFKKGEIYYISPLTQIKLTPKDNTQVSEVYYYINGKKYKYSYFIDLSKFYGLNTLFFDAIDIAGNKYRKYIRIFIDNSSPSTKVLINNPKFVDRDTFFISSSTQISFKAIDKHSKIKQTYFALNNDNYSEYNKPLTIDKQGFYLLKYYSVDVLDNIEQPKEAKIFVDNTPPQIQVIFNVEPYDIEIINNDTLPVFPSNLKIYLSVVDEKTGEEITYYSLNNINFTSYSKPIKISLTKKEKIITLTVKSEDKLGNKTVKTTKFIIRKK